MRLAAAWRAASSGRPRNCLGNYGGNSPDGDAGGYGSVYFYCSFDGGVTQVATPRGSQGRLPWNITLDANVTYQPFWAKGLKMRIDVFNLFNGITVGNAEDGTPYILRDRAGDHRQARDRLPAALAVRRRPYRRERNELALEAGDAHRTAREEPIVEPAEREALLGARLRRQPIVRHRLELVERHRHRLRSFLRALR